SMGNRNRNRKFSEFVITRPIRCQCAPENCSTPLPRNTYYCSCLTYFELFSACRSLITTTALPQYTEAQIGCSVDTPCIGRHIDERRVEEMKMRMQMWDNSTRRHVHNTNWYTVYMVQCVESTHTYPYIPIHTHRNVCTS